MLGKSFRKKPLSRREKYFKELFRDLIYIVILLGVVSTIPQVVKIWYEKDASGVSIISWGTYLFLSVFWVFYGILHRKRAIVLKSMVWIILNLLIVVGIVLYT